MIHNASCSANDCFGSLHIAKTTTYEPILVQRVVHTTILAGPNVPFFTVTTVYFVTSSMETTTFPWACPLAITPKACFTPSRVNG